MFRLKKDKSSPGGVPQLETRISSPGKRYRAKALTKEEVSLLMAVWVWVRFYDLDRPGWITGADLSSRRADLCT